MAFEKEEHLKHGRTHRDGRLQKSPSTSSSWTQGSSSGERLTDYITEADAAGVWGLHIRIHGSILYSLPRKNIEQGTAKEPHVSRCMGDFVSNAFNPKPGFELLRQYHRSVLQSR